MENVYCNWENPHSEYQEHQRAQTSGTQGQWKNQCTICLQPSGFIDHFEGNWIFVLPLTIVLFLTHRCRCTQKDKKKISARLLRNNSIIIIINPQLKNYNPLQNDSVLCFCCNTLHKYFPA